MSTIKMIIFPFENFFKKKQKKNNNFWLYRTHFVTNCKQNVFILENFFPENIQKFSFDSYILNKLITNSFCKQSVLDTT